MRARDGATLLELIVAVGLIALLLGCGAARLQGVRDPIRLLGASQELAASLRLARSRALARGARVRVTVGGSPLRIALDEGAGPVGVRQLAHVVLTGAPAGGGITFTALGAGQNGTFTLAIGGRTRRVVVSQRGRVRLG